MTNLVNISDLFDNQKVTLKTSIWSENYSLFSVVCRLDDSNQEFGILKKGEHDFRIFSRNDCLMTILSRKTHISDLRLSDLKLKTTQVINFEEKFDYLEQLFETFNHILIHQNKKEFFILSREVFLKKVIYYQNRLIQQLDNLHQGSELFALP